MGKVTIQVETTKNPITLIGKEAGICYGSNTSNDTKNYKRGLMNIRSGHGRTMEYPQVYAVLDGYSARVIRELYTHIGGGPTRLQASTRYIEYGNFNYIVPHSVEKNQELLFKWTETMAQISEAIKFLEEKEVPKEDTANLLPLGMTTKIVLRTNLRNLIDMAHQRLCARAYWEYRELMRDLMEALRQYSDEWRLVVNEFFVPKCEVTGYCAEHNGCGRKHSKAEHEDIMALGKLVQATEKLYNAKMNKDAFYKNKSIVD